MAIQSHSCKVEVKNLKSLSNTIGTLPFLMMDASGITRRHPCQQENNLWSFSPSALDLHQNQNLH